MSSRTGRGGGSTVFTSEVWGRIVNNLQDDRERCRVIPLVCKDLRRVHNQCPPQRDHLHVSTSVDRSVVAWYTKLATTLVSISFRPAGEAPPSGYHVEHLPQLLALASVQAPQLRSVVIALQQAPSRQVVNSLGYLDHITRLELGHWKIPLSGGVEEVQQLAGLRSLESLSLMHLDLKETGTPPAYNLSAAANAMWTTLATLTSLQHIHLSLLESSVNPHSRQSFFRPRHPYLFDKLTVMTRLRSMELDNIEHCIEQPRRMHASLSTLTQLTALSVKAPHMCQEYRTLATLPCLKRLDLVVYLPSTDHQSMGRLLSTNLTRLSITGDEHPPEPGSVSALPMTADLYFDMRSPALPHLQELTLCRLSLMDRGFNNDALFRALSSLTKLDMGCNRYFRPPPVSCITTLKVLALQENEDLQLMEEDFELLATLPSLTTADFRCKNKHKSWWPKSVNIVLGLARSCPHIELYI